MKKADIIDSMMKNNPSIPDCLDFDNPNVKKILLKDKGRLRWEREYNYGNLRVITHIRWNKERLFFNCSVVLLRRQENGEWKAAMRFDDAHGYRHCDYEKKEFSAKIPMSTLIRIECPILSEIIKSLPKHRAEEWKRKLFDEIGFGIQKRGEFFKSRNKFKSKIKK